MPCESPPSRPPIRMGTDTSGSDMVVKLYTSWFSGVAGQPPPELRYMWVPIWTPPHPAGLTASLVSDPEGVRGLVARSKRSEEHTSELQSRGHLVCRILLDKKKVTRV